MCIVSWERTAIILTYGGAFESTHDAPIIETVQAALDLLRETQKQACPQG